jgi:hypothetical protein
MGLLALDELGGLGQGSLYALVRGYRGPGSQSSRDVAAAALASRGGGFEETRAFMRDFRRAMAAGGRGTVEWSTLMSLWGRSQGVGRIYDLEDAYRRREARLRAARERQAMLAMLAHRRAEYLASRQPPPSSSWARGRVMTRPSGYRVPPAPAVPPRRPVTMAVRSRPRTGPPMPAPASFPGSAWLRSIGVSLPGDDWHERMARSERRATGVAVREARAGTPSPYSGQRISLTAPSAPPATPSPYAGQRVPLYTTPAPRGGLVTGSGSGTSPRMLSTSIQPGSFFDPR